MYLKTSAIVWEVITVRMVPFSTPLFFGWTIPLILSGLYPALWVRIGSDLHHFAESGSVYQFKQMKKLINFTFFLKISKCCQKYWKYDTLTLMRKIKHFKLGMLWLKVTFSSYFPTSVKLEGGPAWGSASFWYQSGSGSGSWSAST